MRKLIWISIITMSAAVGCGNSGNPTGPDDREEYLPFTVTLRDDHDRTVNNATVIAMPDSVPAVSDSGGVAVFDSLDAGTNSLIIRREYYQDYQRQITSDILDRGTLTVVLESRGPVITITSPPPGIVRYEPPILFSAEATDPEDGLMDGNLLWYSNVDGKLGGGAEMYVESLSAGKHVITCSATDNDGKADSASVSIDVQIPINSSSYFPAMPAYWWVYHHPTQTYHVEREDGLFESWTLGDLHVEIDNRNRRTMTLDLRYTFQSITKYYDYTVTDQLSMDGDAIYVAGTTETMVMRDNRIDNPILYNVQVTTEYTPEYMLIPDTYDPTTIPQYNGDIRTDVSWIYKAPFDPEFRFTESYTVNTAVAVGEPEHVNTPYLSTEAVPVTYSHGDARKTWWLAPGIGILKLEYRSYNVPTTAVLTSSSIPRTVASKQVLSRNERTESALSVFSPAPVQNDAETPSVLSGFQRVRDIAGAFLPR